MKTEHRHELKTNELAEWLANSPRWAKENITVIAAVSIAVVLIAASYFYYRYQKYTVSARKRGELTELIARLPQYKQEIIQSQSKGVDNSYVLIQAADNLLSMAQNTKNNQMAAMALIKQAETLRTELHYRAGTISRQDLNLQLDKAKAGYTEAIDKAAGNSSLVAAAKFGIGLCEEEFGNFTQAQQVYRSVAEDPNFQGTVAAAAAKQRLSTMADYEKKIVFKPAPKLEAAQTKIAEPQIKLKPADVNAAPDSLKNPPLSLPPAK
jgi:hypothetical protein